VRIGATDRPAAPARAAATESPELKDGPLLPADSSRCARVGASLAEYPSIMPRRSEPDELAIQVGQRIREIRHEEGLTIQELAETSELGSKGHLSSMERGLVRPNINTLKQVANGLGVLPLDLLTFPKDDLRQRLVDATRQLSVKRISEALRWLVKGGVSARR
jgi:transcriptional regulator with XRE-family HTH domain